MLGYIEAEKPELKVREFAVYNGWYCGLCKEAGRQYGQLVRMDLSYDMAFLAMFLSSLKDGKEDIRQEHCIAHHIRKKNVVYDPALEYAADMMVLLGWENYLDDRQDGDGDQDPLRERLLKGAAAPGLRKSSRRAAEKHPEAAGQIRASLRKLYSLEKENCSSPDEPAEAFADVMRAIFTGWFHQAEDAGSRLQPEPERNGAGGTAAESAPAEGEARKLSGSGNGSSDAAERIVSEFAAALGRWIYLLDALDDLEEDAASGSYNPLLAQQRAEEAAEENVKSTISGTVSSDEDPAGNHRKSTEAAKDFRSEANTLSEATVSDIRKRMEPVLYYHLESASKAFQLLDIRKNRGILENILYLGLRRKTDSILQGDSSKAAVQADHTSPAEARVS